MNITLTIINTLLVHNIPIDPSLSKVVDGSGTAAYYFSGRRQKLEILAEYFNRKYWDSLQYEFQDTTRRKNYLCKIAFKFEEFLPVLNT